MPWELSERQKRAILENSIERVVNTSIKVSSGMAIRATGSMAEDAGTNAEDWESLKSVVCLLWDRERDAIFREQMAARGEKI